ncbi:MAG: hypothetical protein GIW95_05830 [Candidatus Eremiobacteraeota bacterium]|nr:hypothetical protein [Candidatus Eremiobacteraeota bacterium]
MERTTKEPLPTGSGARDVDEKTPKPDERPAGEVNPASNDENITDYDKTVADSFPASDPPAQP